MPKPGGSPALKWTGTKGNDKADVASLDALKRTTYDGGAGYDTFDLSGSGITSGITLTVNLGNPGTSRLWADDPFHGSWWNFSLSGAVIENSIKNFEKIVGTGFNDYINFFGGTVARVVDAGAGDDAIYMGSSTGTNTLIGGLGSDQLFGSRTTSLLIGGTYDGVSATEDETRDVFTMYSGTILDFEVGVDALYIDGATTSASWVNVSTGYGSGARLTMAADRVITLIGVDADTMNAVAKGYVLGVRGEITSGAGDDFIAINHSADADHLIFPAGSGDDEVVGFEVDNDSLTFASAVTFSEVDHHGDTALLATYDGGASSVLLIGLGLADVPSLEVDILV